MALDLTDCQFIGPALPEPFVRFELEKELTRLKLLPKTTGKEGKQLKADWEAYRRNLAQLAVRGGPVRVRNHAVEPIVRHLGYDDIVQQPPVETREGREVGGYLLTNGDNSARLRVWITSLDEDLDAPAKRGRAYRFSHLRIAQRVLLASGERVGLLTNGVELRLLISDPARPDSQVVIPIDPGWKRSRDVPDSFRFLLALGSPEGVKAAPELVDKARLQQARVTKDLRSQARQAVERFIQEVLDHPVNRPWLEERTGSGRSTAPAAASERDQLARDLWHEGLVIVYRLLFVLKLESSDDPARSFTFASTSLWRNTFSPSMALARYAHRVLDRGEETGGLLEGGLRTLFKMFVDGVECTELNVKPLGGALFGTAAAPVLTGLRWGERAVAHLLDQLLWTTPKHKKGARERVHYGPLDVEDLGRVYEALLELEPGIAAEPVCRLRRQKLEVVVPVAQGEKYRPLSPARERGVGGDGDSAVDDNDDEADEPDDDDAEETPKRGKKTAVQWIEEIPPGRFYLRVGLGRKASGSYYTPHSFVRFLVQETLGPQVAERSPHDDPNPGEILKLKVLDPAMGSGHFLVEACRFLGQHLYEAARLCDENAIALERRAERAGKAERENLEGEARKYRQRVIDLPDPDDEIVRYLPSRSPEGEETGISQRKAEALCRRMVAVHCLYGVDKNPLAVELAKLALWLESHAEGMPLTFLDHRLVVGDSLTGPFWDKLIMRPGKPDEPVEGIFHQGLTLALQNRLRDALQCVRHLEATVGISLAEVEEKQRMKAELDRALRPFRIIAAAWAGGVMLGPERCDDLAYAELLKSVAETGDIPERLESERLRAMIGRGVDVGSVPLGRTDLYELLRDTSAVPALPYDLTFPEVFYPSGIPRGQHGFSVVLGNPPWDRIETDPQAYFGQFDFQIVEAIDSEKRERIIHQLRKNKPIESGWTQFTEHLEQQYRLLSQQYVHQVAKVEGKYTLGRPDMYRLFVERGLVLLPQGGFVAWVIPSSFHANEGATGVRRLYLSQTDIRFCYSFENRRKLFEIDSRQKFALVAARKASKGTSAFPAAFYLLDDEWLFADNRHDREVSLDPELIKLTAGDYLSFCEARSPVDLALVVAQRRSQVAEWAEYLHGFGIKTAFGVELHRNPDFQNPLLRQRNTADLFSSMSAKRWEHLPIASGKTVHQYTDQWDALCENYVLARVACGTRHWVGSVRHYRFAFRMKAASTNERTMIAVILTPGFVCEQTLTVETAPGDRCTSNALAVLALANSYQFDYQVRQRVTTSLSNYILAAVPIPALTHVLPLMIHCALRLTCNHSGYEPLWREQVGDAWREPGTEPFTWPVLGSDDERWEVRAAIDAVVADAYGLSRDQYEHVLSTFSHASYRKAPELCLAKFDELKQIGLDAFTRKYDPYHDIPLNENLPQPVIDLPIPGEGTDDDGEFRLKAEAPPKRGRRKK